jgi:hypothetical protein
VRGVHARRDESHLKEGGASSVGVTGGVLACALAVLASNLFVLPPTPEIKGRLEVFAGPNLLALSA